MRLGGNGCGSQGKGGKGRPKGWKSTVGKGASLHKAEREKGNEQGTKGVAGVEMGQDARS